MKTFRVTISADKYPSEYTVQATNWATAVARAVREWHKRFKGSRTETLSIKAVKGGKLLTSDEQ